MTAVADATATAPPGVAGAVQRAGAALDRPMWLLDAAGRVVVGPPDGGSPVPDEVGSDPAQVARWLDRAPGDDDRHVVAAVPTDHPRGAYVVLARRPRDDVAAVRAALGVVATTVAGRLAVDRLGAERDARHRMGLLAELLRSGGRLSADAPGRLLAQGWRLTGHHIGLRIDVPSALDPVALRPDVLKAFADAGVTAEVVEQGAAGRRGRRSTSRPGRRGCGPTLPRCGGCSGCCGPSCRRRWASGRSRRGRRG